MVTKVQRKFIIGWFIFWIIFFFPVAIWYYLSRKEGKSWFHKHPVWTAVLVFLLVSILLTLFAPEEKTTNGSGLQLVNEANSEEADSQSSGGSSLKAQIEESQVKEYVKESYTDMCLTFDSDSKYTDLQKERIFLDEYKGKYVSWTGVVTDIDTSILDNIRLYVEMGCGDGKIYMNKNQYDALLLISKDEEVSFIGRFDQQPTPGFFDSADFVLNDGEIAE